ncbi:hypothetical protein [Jannaschia pohangensis]|uniref:Uncharacterized protein n=1 Tax=Jannaschia pohangensis TaxID=390807 RepID=A0A1I3JCE0_9RHOB|nr:hypothetical protein [Jannaschia pohangensis]SFI57922.1 hypothetical protein SAMN04488095_1281 [Jannaschia pohangensis]
MNRDTAQTIADILVIVIAIWFLTSAAFADMAGRPAFSAIALFVIASSLWRIWRRYRGKP